MVVGEPKRSIMEGIENTGDVRLHDHRLRLKQRFDIIRKLGQGTYGKVQLGINKKTGQEVAIKTIKKCKIETEADLVRIRREVQIMSSVRHPNIVHIYEVFENSEKMILVMEYCAGGELYDYLSQQKVLQEDEARRLFRQIATAVYYCHKHKICHRDLKLENVLLDEHGSAKIADFGLSNVFEERRLLSTFCGSPLYASPEIVKGTPYIGPEVDCWSLGVLLYTLVYGAMPFDGSNFKRLVKQISTGDYFEPKNPSSASPLIRDMLTVDPIQRADITHICDNPWVNKGSDVSCLELAEALANETPVRLDLLLSLAPPPVHGSDKLVVTDEVSNTGPEGSPGRSMSLANVDHTAERRILEMVAEGGTDAIKPSPTRTIVSAADQPKRKLETAVSMDSAPSQRKKERFVRSGSRVCQISPDNDSNSIISPVENNSHPAEIQRDVSMAEQSKPVEQPLPAVPVEDKQEKVNNKIKDSPKQTIPVSKVSNEVSNNRATPSSPGKISAEKSPPRKSLEKESAAKKVTTDEENVKNDSQGIKQPTERRKSRILDTAEKLNNLSIQPTPAAAPAPAVSSPPPPKPKKVIIPGVSVGSFKEQFERRASLTSGNVPSTVELKKPSSKPAAVSAKGLADKKMHSVDSEHPVANIPSAVDKESNNIKLQNIGIEPSPQVEAALPPEPEPKKLPTPEVINKISKPLHKSESLREPSTKKDSLHNSLSLEDARRSLQQSMALLNQAKSDYQHSKSVDENSEKERQKQLKVAREIISNAIGEENGKKVQRICMGGKPPVPYGSGGRSASGSLSLGSLGGSPPTSPPHHPAPTPPRTFRTEVQHRVDDVRNKFLPTSRGGSVERIIPIQFANEAPKAQNTSNTHTQLPYQRNHTMPYRLSSVPRGNSVQSDVEKESQPSTPSTSDLPRVEPIKKSPREFIIPIAVEGVGYVTPRQGSLEPSETPTKLTPSSINFASRFPKPRRLSSLVSGGESEDEDDLHMHRLRSSRRVRADAEKDSISSGEEDDDEGFELLTAENLFSTLLDRVRSLTNRLNGEEGTGFPQHHQSLFNNLHSPFFNRRDGPTWRRSTSRDIASDFDSMFPSHTTFPRGSRRSSRKAAKTNREQNQPSGSNTKTSHTQDDPPNQSQSHSPELLDLSDLDLSQIELSEKEVETLSGLTPGLSRRLQQQLLAHLPPAAARSLRRTLSAHLPPRRSPHKYARSLSATKTSPPCDADTQHRHATDNKSDRSSTVRLKSSIMDDEDESSVSHSSVTSNADKEQKKYLDLRDISDSHSSRDRNFNLSDVMEARSTSPSFTECVATRQVSNGNTTPDRSVLSKYLSPEKTLAEEYSSMRNNNDYNSILTEPSYIAAYGSSNSTYNGIPLGGSLRRRTLRTPPSEPCRRKVSRFLRPDFFDTPREESIYFRDKRDKELETQKVLKEIRQKRNKSSELYSPDPCSPITPTDVTSLFEHANSRCGYRNSLSPVGIPIARDKSRSVTPFYPILDNISEHHNDHLTDTSLRDALIAIDRKLDASNNIHTTNNESSEQSLTNIKNGIKHDENKAYQSGIVRPKSFPTKPIENIPLDDSKYNNASVNKSRPNSSTIESKIIRPKSYPNTTPSPEKYSSNVLSKEESGAKTNICKKGTDMSCSENIRNNENHALEDKNVSVSFNISLPTKIINCKNTTKNDMEKVILIEETPNHLEHDNMPSENKSDVLISEKTPDVVNKEQPFNKTILNNSELISKKCENIKIDDVNSQELKLGVESANIDSKMKKSSLDTLRLPQTAIDRKECTPVPESVASTAQPQEKNLVKENKNVSNIEKITETGISDDKKKKTLVKKKIVIKKKGTLKKADSLPDQPKNNEESKEVVHSNKDTNKMVDQKLKEEKVSPKKKSVLHSIGERFEKFRNDSFSKSNSQEKEVSNETKAKPNATLKEEHKLSRIENVMRALRERSVPSGNQSEPITESGLIKRAVTITNLPTLDTKSSSSKKTVNKVLGLFKKIESKDTIPISTSETINITENSSSGDKKVTSNECKNAEALNSTDNSFTENKPKRPTSLLLNGIGKRVQACYNGTTSDSVLVNNKKDVLNKDENTKLDGNKSNKKGLRLDFSRLPRLNQGMFNKRNSLDLSRSRESSESKEVENKNSLSEITPLKDVSDISNVVNNTETSSQDNSNRLLLDNNANTSSSNTVITPNWSPDYDASKFMMGTTQFDADLNHNSTQQPQRIHEATTPDPDNIEDRIRRKSFYSRFNEKKNKRKSLLVGPGAKEYNPTERIHAPADNDNSYLNNKYDFSPTSSKSERSLDFSKASQKSDRNDCMSPTKYRISSNIGNEPLSAYKSLDRTDRRYMLDPQYQPHSESSVHYSTPRYSRTVSLHDNYDTKLPVMDSKNNNLRYGRSFSLLSPNSYHTYSPRIHSRNSAIMLRDDEDIEQYADSVLSKLRNRKKLVATSPMDDEETYLDTKFRSNHTSNNEHDTSADKAE